MVKMFMKVYQRYFSFLQVLAHWQNLQFFTIIFLNLLFSSCYGFNHGRTILEKMLLLITFLLLSLATKQLFQGVVGRFWTVVRMIIFSYTILIMEVLGCSVSSSSEIALWKNSELTLLVAILLFQFTDPFITLILKNYFLND